MFRSLNSCELWNEQILSRQSESIFIAMHWPHLLQKDNRHINFEEVWYLLFEWDPFHPCVSRSNQIEISFYAHLRGRIGFKTVNPSLSTGKDFLIHSLGKD